MKTKQKNVITTTVSNENIIKLPKELLCNPLLKDAEISINEDIVTFKLPMNETEGSDILVEIWQYIHHNEMWAHTKFVK